MTLLPNTYYAMTSRDKDIYLVYHSNNNRMKTTANLTKSECGIDHGWVYDPNFYFHSDIVFHDAEEYKIKHPEYFL